jgi:polar amino acid transport system substrate-binding protein
VTAAPPSRIAAGLFFACALVVFGGCAWIDGDSHGGPRRPPPAHPDSSPQTRTPACRQTSFKSLAPRRLPRPRHMPAGTFMRRIQDRGHLTVGVDESSHGLGFVDHDTRYMGFDIDLVREIARAIFGFASIHYTPITTRQRESAIASQEVDIVASAFSRTCAPLRHLLLSSVYYRAQQRLLVRKDSDVRDLSDLREQRVCATRGSTSLARLEQEPGVEPYPEDERTSCLVDLQEGDVAAITAADAILLGFTREDPETMIVGPCIGVDRYAMAIDKAQRPFVRFVNAVLARLRRNGRAARFREHWLKGLTPPTAAEISRCDRGASRGPR